MASPYEQYANDVVSGKIVSGKLMKLAAQRFLDDLNDTRFTFDAKKVERAFNFVAKLRHFTGKSSGKPFILEPWQAFVVANIVGFYWAGTDSRRFTSSS